MFNTKATMSSLVYIANIFWKPPHPLGTHQKNFQKIDFWTWNWIFQAWGSFELEKTWFWAIFRFQNFFTNFVSWFTTLESESVWLNEKICRADFGLNNYFLKKVILTICMLKKRSKSEGNSSFFAWKNRKKFKIER